MTVNAWVDNHGRVRCGGKNNRCRWSFGKLVIDRATGFIELGTDEPILISGVRLDPGWQHGTGSSPDVIPTSAARKAYERQSRRSRPDRLPDPNAKKVIASGDTLKGQLLVSPTTAPCMDPGCKAVNLIDPATLLAENSSG